jgi:hypothetical protein
MPEGKGPQPGSTLAARIQLPNRHSCGVCLFAGWHTLCDTTGCRWQDGIQKCAAGAREQDSKCPAFACRLVASGCCSPSCCSGALADSRWGSGWGIPGHATSTGRRSRPHRPPSPLAAWVPRHRRALLRQPPRRAPLARPPSVSPRASRAARRRSRRLPLPRPLRPPP